MGTCWVDGVLQKEIKAQSHGILMYRYRNPRAPFTPDNFYNKTLLHQAPVTTSTLDTGTPVAPAHFYNKQLLHQAPLYTRHLIDQTPSTPETFYTRHILNQTFDLLHQTIFTTRNTKTQTHQTQKHTYRKNANAQTQKKTITKKTHTNAVTPDNFLQPTTQKTPTQKHKHKHRKTQTQKHKHRKTLQTCKHTKTKMQTRKHRKRKHANTVLSGNFLQQKKLKTQKHNHAFFLLHAAKVPRRSRAERPTVSIS